MEDMPIQKKRGRPSKKEAVSEENKIDVALTSSPVRKNFRVNQLDLPLKDHLGVPQVSALGMTQEEVEESSMPYGSEELREKTRGYAPRTRLNNSRESQFRSREERIEFYSKQTDTETLGKTFLADELINDHENFYMWIRKSIRDRPDGNNLRNLERLGWLYTSADKAPNMAYFDYDGDLNDSANTIEGGGLIVGELDIHIHQRRMQKQKSLRDDQARFKERLLQIPGEQVQAMPYLPDESAMYPSAPPIYPQYQQQAHPMYPGQNVPTHDEQPVYRAPQQPIRQAAPMPLPNDNEPLYRRGTVSYPTNPGSR